jgi:hypothetical protein
MYKIGKTKDTPAQPMFWWRGQEVTFHEALGIKAAADKSGAKVTLAVRDLRSSANYHYSRPSVGNLKVRHFVLNKASTLPLTDGRQIKQERIPATTMIVASDLLKRLGNPGQLRRTVSYGYSGNNPEATTTVLARTDPNKDGKVLEYVLPREIPVFTMDEKPNVEYFTRRYLISEEAHAPCKDGFALVVQGTKEQQDAFFAQYPWLKDGSKKVKDLPLIKVVRNADGKVTNGTTRSFKSAENMFKWHGTSATNRPSDAWEALEELPDEDIDFVWLERFIPNDAPPVDGIIGNSGLSPSSQFSWLRAMSNMRNVLDGETPDIYGFRFTKRKQTPPDGVILLPDTLDKRIKEWFDPDRFDDEEVHGFSMLLRYGPEGLFSDAGFSDAPLNLEDQKGRKGYSWYYRTVKREILDQIRDPAVYRHIRKVCEEDSPMRKLAELYWKLLDWDKTKDDVMDKYHRAFKALRRTGAGTPKIMRDCAAEIGTNFKAFISPLQESIDDVWETYSLFGLLDNAPNGLQEMKQLIEYVTIVDTHNKRGKQ